MARMQHQDVIELSLELITPAFIGGARPREVDPFMMVRPSSIRGALRWWFRAAAAAVMRPAGKNDDSRMVAALHEAESGVFGNTEQSSAVAVLPPRDLTPSRLRRYARDTPDRDEWPGLRYLGYGLFDSPRGAQAIIEGTPFTLPVVIRRPTTGLTELIGATLWLWTHLGGLGGRSRRGFGSLHLRELRGLDLPDGLGLAAPGFDDLEHTLRSGLDRVIEIFRDNLPRFTTYQWRPENRPHRNIRTIAGIKTFTVLPPALPKSIQCMEWAGRLFKDFRSTLARRDHGMSPLPDYTSVKTALQRHNTPRSVERAAFGLPLRFYFRSLHGDQTTLQPKGADRLASPFFVRIRPVADSRYAAVFFDMSEARDADLMLGQKLAQRPDRRRNIKGGLVETNPSGELITAFREWALQQAQRVVSGHQGGDR